MSDAVLIAIFTISIPALATVVSTIVIAVMQSRTRAAVQVAGDTATQAAVSAGEKAAEVSTTLKASDAATEKKLNGLAKVANDTHTLVNSNMGVQLKLGMDLSDFKAMTTKLPEDIQAAKLARHKYEEHCKKQAIVDATPK